MRLYRWILCCWIEQRVERLGRELSDAGPTIPEKIPSLRGLGPRQAVTGRPRGYVSDPGDHRLVAEPIEEPGLADGETLLNRF